MSPRIRVMLVEDNQELVANLYEFLGEDAYQLDSAIGAMAAFHLLESVEYDVVVLDVMLPGGSGFSICRRLREAGNNTPVVFMTARDSIEDKEEGFLSGGDDYVVKPFPLRELKLRIDAVLRRRTVEDPMLRIPGVSFHRGTLEVVVQAGPRLALSGLGARIFEELIRSHPHFVSYEALSARLWPEREVDVGTLRTHVYVLRKQLQEAAGVTLIRTLHGRGYALVSPQKPD